MDRPGAEKCCDRRRRVPDFGPRMNAKSYPLVSLRTRTSSPPALDLEQLSLVLSCLKYSVSTRLLVLRGSQLKDRIQP